MLIAVRIHVSVKPKKYVQPFWVLHGIWVVAV